MKKLKLILFLLFGVTNLALASYTSNIYVGSRTTSTTVTITSTTVNFPIQEIRLSLEGVSGDYVIVSSSWGKTATDYMYVTPSVPLIQRYDRAPIDLRGTSMQLKFTIPAGSTFYYYIGGHK